ncbi:MAG: bifunctional UDP-3-O-[3-hydroxymyristoyl] N-acetylglucosamine deacetylase/3-hydroxyacyl-ACP dehydratase, partial [Chitinophagaceae bacterium]
MSINFDYNKQHTIAQEVVIKGKGLHTGGSVTMKLLPAEVNTGYIFQRVDLPGKPLIEADCDLVVDTSRGTTLEKNSVRVNTVEHILATLVGLSIDNVLIQVDNMEIPIMDGSALFFVEFIKKAGIVEQEAEKIWYLIEEKLMFEDPVKKVQMLALSADNYRINTLIDFNSPVLGTQHAFIEHTTEFETKIAPSRTFCFLHELEILLTHNLIKGGDFNNAIIVVDKPLSKEETNRLSIIFNKQNLEVKSEGYLNNIKLRFPNEPARHKLLDIMGDLALVGFPIQAHIIANRPGHHANVEFAKIIKQYIKKNRNNSHIPKYDPNDPPIYDLPAIEKMLPHRYPFLLIDKVIEKSENHIVGIKNVTFNEHFFIGHFPGNPVMPGVLQIEALAQTGGILALTKYPDPENYDTYFLKIDNCKFKQMIKPGDT